MKKSMLLLSLIGSLTLPVAMHADPPATKSKQTKKAAVQKTVAAKPAPAPQHETDFITRTAFTGSHIPMVYRQYNGRIDSASNAAVYGQEDLNHSGYLDVRSDLQFLDPSITGRGIR